MIAPKYNTIVIGSGISGLKSAIELTKNGVDTLVLEARDRIGGRMHTIETESGLKLDLGASWFHDCLTNPLLKKSIKKGNVEFYFDNGRSDTYDRDAGLIDKNMKVEPVVSEMNDYIKHFCGPLDAADDVSLREAALRYLRLQRDVLDDTQLQLAPQLLRYLEMWIGSSWDVLSARLLSESSHMGRDAMIHNGYRTVYDNELEELKKYTGVEDVVGSVILLEKVVYRIDFKDRAKEITVSVKNSKNEIEQYRCEYLVCSVPLSVLQLQDKKETGHIEWNPPLPRKLTSVLQRMSYSQLGKVFFEFDHAFWPQEVDRFFFVAHADSQMTQEIKNGSQKLSFPGIRTDPELRSTPAAWEYPVLFLNLSIPTGRPVMLALTSSPLTGFVESNPASKFWPVFEPLFAKISGLETSQTPKPVAVQTSNWTNDPFARGSYLGATVGDYGDDGIEAFVEAKDVFDGKGRVRFVGEALIEEGNGCVHGAWMTAERETEKLLRLINRGKL